MNYNKSQNTPGTIMDTGFEKLLRTVIRNGYGGSKQVFVIKTNHFNYT